MNDEEFRNLERSARASNDPEEIALLQSKRSQLFGLGVADAEYLLKYITICNGMCDQDYPIGKTMDYDGETDEEIAIEPAPDSALGRLKILNEQYKFLICSGTVQTDITASNLTDPDEGFVPSAVCW